MILTKGNTEDICLRDSDLGFVLFDFHTLLKIKKVWFALVLEILRLTSSSEPSSAYMFDLRWIRSVKSSIASHGLLSIL